MRTGMQITEFAPTVVREIHDGEMLASVELAGIHNDGQVPDGLMEAIEYLAGIGIMRDPHEVMIFMVGFLIALRSAQLAELDDFESEF